MQSLCESYNTQAGLESSKGFKIVLFGFFISSFRDNRNIISGDQQRTTIRSLYGSYSSKVDRFEMKNINRRFEEFLKMYCVCKRFTRTTNNIQLSYEVCFSSMCKWLIKRRLNLTEVIPHVEICYRIWLPN